MHTKDSWACLAPPTRHLFEKQSCCISVCSTKTGSTVPAWRAAQTASQTRLKFITGHQSTTTATTTTAAAATTTTATTTTTRRRILDQCWAVVWSAVRWKQCAYHGHSSVHCFYMEATGLPACSALAPTHTCAVAEKHYRMHRQL